MNIEKMIQELDNEKSNRRWYENIWFETSYYFSDMFHNIRTVKTGLYNFWKFRSDIYNWRWYDYGFLHTTLRARLNDMAVGWENAHYVGSDYEKRTLEELVQILDDIDLLEESCNLETYGQIDNLYQEFGIKLFSIQTLHKIDKEFDKGENVDTCSNFRRLWD
ncbi:MAG: hypothetical protein J7L15_05720 [Clostridiales bacterium]|nr:hypothetical protein [Clostridiales bacterium]